MADDGTETKEVTSPSTPRVDEPATPPPQREDSAGGEHKENTFALRPDLSRDTSAAYSRRLFALANPGAGDCLFYSVAQALNAYRGYKLAELTEHMATFGLDPGTVTANQLRLLSKTCLLAGLEELNGPMSMWLKMYGTRADYTVEFAQVRPAQGKTLSTLDQNDRFRIFNEAMNASVVWGDETDIQTLEALLRIKIMVLTNKTMQLGARHARLQPILWMALCLKGRHYELAQWRDWDQAVYSAYGEREIPYVLRFLAHRDCARAEEWWINLKHLYIPGTREEPQDKVEPDGTAVDVTEVFLAHYLKCSPLVPEARALLDAELASAKSARVGAGRRRGGWTSNATGAAQATAYAAALPVGYPPPGVYPDATWDKDSGGHVHPVANYTAPAAAAAKRLEAKVEGGEATAGTLGASVTILQCGVVVSRGPAAATHPSTQTTPLSSTVRKTPFQNILPDRVRPVASL